MHGMKSLENTVACQGIGCIYARCRTIHKVACVEHTDTNLFDLFSIPKVSASSLEVVPTNG